MRIKLSVVIPNWNGKRLLEKNLPAVLKACQEWAETGWEIIDKPLKLLVSFSLKAVFRSNWG